MNFFVFNYLSFAYFRLPLICLFLSVALFSFYISGPSYSRKLIPIVSVFLFLVSISFFGYIANLTRILFFPLGRVLLLARHTVTNLTNITKSWRWSFWYRSSLRLLEAHSKKSSSFLHRDTSLNQLCSEMQPTMLISPVLFDQQKICKEVL